VDRHLTVTAPPRFTGRRALVTGASRGIGAALAERLAAEGAHVAVSARVLDADGSLTGTLRETAERLRQYGTIVAAVSADLTDDEARARIVPEAEAALGGPIDILVNNAAAAMYQSLDAFPLRRRRLIFEVNVHAPIDLAQAVIPGMRAAGAGWIVNVSSGGARHWDGPPFTLGVLGSTGTVYGASKAALNRLTNGLAAELADTGIRVNTIEPRAAVMTDAAAARVGGKLPDDRIESLEQMVEAIVALCDCAADVTGRTVVSLDLIEQRGLTVRALNGGPLPT
jgi:citronellol/citronellal dehydrogenase